MQRFNLLCVRSGWFCHAWNKITKKLENRVIIVKLIYYMYMLTLNRKRVGNLNFIFSHLNYSIALFIRPVPKKNLKPIFNYQNY